MNVLVVGANGFLGRHIVTRCQQQNWTVYGTYNKRHDNIPPRTKRLSMRELWLTKEQFSYIFITAAAIPYPDRPIRQKELIAVNIELPISLTKKFPYAKIIFSSSVSVYGNHKNTITETSCFNNPDLYGLSKIAGECVVNAQKKFAIIRFSSLIGKGMYQGTFIPSIIADAKRTNIITLLGKGKRKQDYLHVSDAARLCMLAAKHPGNGIFLGVSGSSYTNVRVAKIVQQYLPKTKIRYKDTDTSFSSVYDNTYTAETLHFRAHMSMSGAIGEMIT